MVAPRSSPNRNGIVWTVLWLCPLMFVWGGMIVLSRQTTLWAIAWTHRLFGWILLLTYVLLWSWAISISRKPRLTALRSIACTVTLVGICLCLELPAMLQLVQWPLIFQQLTGDVQHLTWAYQRDRELGFRRRPYNHWSERPSSDIEFQWMMPRSLRQSLDFTYDRWGYRNAMDLEQAEVALIGDSYIEGWYVSDEQTTARRLQARLGQPVINLGVSGYGSMQEFLALKKDGLRFHPKVVVWFFFEGNDLYDDHEFENFLLAEPPSSMETKAHSQALVWHQGWRQRSFTLAALDQLRRWSDPILPNKAPYFGLLSTSSQSAHTIYFSSYAAIPWDAWVAGRWEKTQATLVQVVQFCRAQGIHVLFAFVPIKFRVYRPFMTFAPDSPCRTWDVWPIVERFNAFCQTAGAPCLDLTELFQNAVRDGGMPYAAVDSHWSPAGHDLVAARLATELRQRGWLTAAPTVR